MSIKCDVAPQVTDTNYGWDSFNSIFITHYPGLYFFTFSVKADADYKYDDNDKLTLSTDIVQHDLL